MKFRPPADGAALDAAPTRTYLFTPPPPRLDRVRYNECISSEQLALERAEVERGEATVADVMRRYGLCENGKPLPGTRHVNSRAESEELAARGMGHIKFFWLDEDYQK